jgi:hypothetical protein
MPAEPTYTVLDLTAAPTFPAMGLTLKEAFTRIMALSGRRCVFTRTSRLAHLVMTDPAEGEPSFESPLAVDAQARDAIMAKCALMVSDASAS